MSGVVVSADEVNAFRSQVAELEATAARDGLTPDQVRTLDANRRTLASIDAQLAAPKAPAVPPLPPGAEGRISPEVWADWSTRNPGREPTGSDVLLMAEKTRIAPRPGTVGLTPYGSSRRGLL